MTRGILAPALAMLLMASGASIAADPPKGDPTNTERNVRDRADTLTPLDQGQNQADIDITANIRKSLVDDDALSTNAQNIKVITNGGVVTLRGPVNDSKEKAAIEAKAKAAPGVTRVDSQLEVAAH
jgi:hyperosmotically inducible periplasmic protein